MVAISLSASRSFGGSRALGDAPSGSGVEPALALPGGRGALAATERSGLDAGAGDVVLVLSQAQSASVVATAKATSNDERHVMQTQTGYHNPEATSRISSRSQRWAGESSVRACQT